MMITANQNFAELFFPNRLLLLNIQFIVRSTENADYGLGVVQTFDLTHCRAYITFVQDALRWSCTESYIFSQETLTTFTTCTTTLQRLDKARRTGYSVIESGEFRIEDVEHRRARHLLLRSLTERQVPCDIVEFFRFKTLDIDDSLADDRDYYIPPDTWAPSSGLVVQGGAICSYTHEIESIYVKDGDQIETLYDNGEYSLLRRGTQGFCMLNDKIRMRTISNSILHTSYKSDGDGWVVDRKFIARGYALYTVPLTTKIPVSGVLHRFDY